MRDFTREQLRHALWRVNRAHDAAAASIAVAAARDFAADCMEAEQEAYIVAQLSGTMAWHTESRRQRAETLRWATSQLIEIKSALSEGDADTDVRRSFAHIAGYLWPALNFAPMHEALVLLAELQSLALSGVPSRVEGERFAITVGGSGKRWNRSPSLTTASVMVAQAFASVAGLDITISKTVSGGTTFGWGSADAVASAGLSVLDEWPETYWDGRRSPVIWRSEHLLTSFADLYDGFALAPTTVSLAGPAVLANPLQADRVVYGLADGRTDITAAALAQQLRCADVRVVQGLDALHSPIIDEASVDGPTIVSEAIDGRINRHSFEVDRLAAEAQIKIGGFEPQDYNLWDALSGRASGRFIATVAGNVAVMLTDDLTDTVRFSEIWSAALGILRSGRAIVVMEELSHVYSR